VFLRLTNAVAVLLWLLMLWAISTPGWDLDLAVPVVLCGILTGIAWWLAVWARITWPRPAASFAVLAEYGLLPTLSALFVMALAYHAPMKLRLWLSEDALFAAVAQVRADPARYWPGELGTEDPERIGWYTMTRQVRYRSPEADPGACVEFSTQPYGFIDEGGFIFSEAGRPPREGEGVSFTHLWGAWYLWIEQH
jgi:hypothetical protein